MSKLYQVLLWVSSALLLRQPAAAQDCLADFTLLGTAVPLMDCTRLTNQGAEQSSGAMWSPQAISLTQDFDLPFTITQCGKADGLVFVLQNAGPVGAVGEAGNNLGYYELPAFAQSVGIELDLYQNAYAPYNDPPYPHLMLALNGNATPVQGPVAMPGLGDCQARIFRVHWNHTAKLLTVLLAGTPVFTYSRDLLADVFRGNPVVWFGFVGATGAVTATQSVCPGSLVATVTPAPIIQVVGSPTLCPGERVVLGVPPYPAGTTYEWSPAAGLNSTSTVGVVASPTATTTYRVRVRKPNGCQLTDSVRIRVVPAPTAQVSPRQVICAGASVQLRATSTEPGTTHTWAPAQGLSSTRGETVLAAPTATTLYTVTTATAFCSRRDTVRVVVLPPLQLRVAALPTTTSGGSTELRATSAVGASYRWTPLTGLSATTGPVVTASPPTTTTYTVTATDAAGCTEQATVVAQPFRLPNIITPNGDGFNDTFRPLVALEPVTLQVFSRWGHLVFEQADYHDGWDAAGLAGGTYYYCLSTAKGERWKGWVEVVK